MDAKHLFSCSACCVSLFSFKDEIWLCIDVFLIAEQEIKKQEQEKNIFLS